MTWRGPSSKRNVARSHLGVSLSRQAGGNDEQHRLAARTEGSWTSTRAHSRSTTHVRMSTSRGWRVHGGSASASRARESTMAGHYASADVGRLLGQPNSVLKREETRTVLRVANAGGLWINVRQRSGSTQTSALNARKSLIFGAPGRIRTHDPLVRRRFNPVQVIVKSNTCSACQRQINLSSHS